MTFSCQKKSWRVKTRLAAWLLTALLCTLGRPVSGDDDSEPMIRDGFEGPRVVWSQEQTDAPITPIKHDRTNRAAHGGLTSERIAFNAGVGSSLFYSYPLPKVPVAKDLDLELFMRANRSGMQIFARVILPEDTDPETKAPSYLLIPGTLYENTNHWQRLELIDLPTAIERQVRVLRATTKRPVSLEGAYIEQLVLNLYSGAGETEVFVDDLLVGPVPADLVRGEAAGVPAIEPEKAVAAPPLKPKGTNPLYRLDRNSLKKRGEDGLYHESVFTAIHAPGADIAKLRGAGFDVLIDPIDADRKRTQEAVERGFALMPVLGRDTEGNLADPDQVEAVVRAYPFQESVMAWCLGDRLGRALTPQARKVELDRARAIVSKLKRLPPGVSRLTTGTIEDDIARYARAPQNLDLMGIRPSSWASSISPMDTLRFLRQRRDLSLRNNAGALYWSMLPATPPPSIPQAIWGNDSPPAGMNPTVQAEQVRLMTYASIAAGYRGVAFRGDAELTADTGPGRMLLLEMSLLNAEIDLCEAIIAGGADPIPEYPTFPPDPPKIPVQAGNRNQKVPVLPEHQPLPGMLAHGIGTRDRRGVLLFVSDYSGDSQFQPGQMARNDVKLTVIAPEGARGFEISPGNFRVLEREAGIGGVCFTLPEFDTTSLVLVTTDVDMALRVESVIKSIRPRAAQMAIEQAEIKFAWVSEIAGRLAAGGHPLISQKIQRERAKTGGTVTNDQADLLQLASENIKVARENLEREDYATAWAEARRASRPLRLIMRGLFQNAQEDLLLANTPAEDIANDVEIEAGRVLPVGPRSQIPNVASAPMASFNTLPQHYVWLDAMKNGYFGQNLVPSGTFDDTGVLEQAGWTNQSYEFQGIVSKVSTVPNSKTGKRRILKMSVDPAEGTKLDTLAPFLDFPAAAIRTPPVSVKAGQFLKITVFVQRPTITPAGAGGVIIRDSIGGEALQFSSTGSFPSLTRVVLYRRVPADGEMSVLLGLAGYGDAYFDDVSIQRIEAKSSIENLDNMARRPSPRLPSTAPPATATARGSGVGTRSSR